MGVRRSNVKGKGKGRDGEVRGEGYNIYTFSVAAQRGYQLTAINSLALSSLSCAGGSDSRSGHQKTTTGTRNWKEKTVERINNCYEN